MAASTAPRSASPELPRAMGWPSLEAIAINGMVGAGIFALPASVSHILGRSSPIAYLTAGLAVLLIALCFAEAGSLFDRSGGPYIYAETAFGRFAGFEMGWVFLLARLTSVAAISNTFAAYLGYFWPAAAAGNGRMAAITLVIAILTAIHCRGVKPGVYATNGLTIAKLIPLLIFCFAGLFFLDWGSFSFTAIDKPGSLAQASLLLLFAFGGFEYASVPSGEVIRSKRVLPLVLISSTAIVVVLYLTIQVVAMGTFPGLAASKTPLASAAANFLGPAGGVLLTLGAVLSATGTNSAALLVGSRMLHALAAGGQLPAVFARVHPRFQTPAVALILFALVAWAFAVSGTFTQLAGVSSVARLIYYAVTCLAIPVLRRKMPAAESRFRLPGGIAVPLLALATCGWLFSGSSANDFRVTGITLGIGAVLYAYVRRTIA
jgi:APA family basic amino acid/polyamine antiporter